MPAVSPLYLTNHLSEVRAQMFSSEKLSLEGYNQLLCFKVPAFLCWNMGQDYNWWNC